MASGYGLNGGPSRCFPFWQEVLACYALNSDTNESKAKCVTKAEDYMECLHHRKELERVTKLQHALRKKLAEDPRADLPSGQEVRKLGLIEKEPEELDLKGPKWGYERRGAF